MGIYLSLALAVGFCMFFIKPSTVDAQEKTLTIGFSTVLSGRAADYGYHQKQGATMALEEINGKGGVNGAGKTTTIKTISGFIRHFDGTIEFQEKRIDDIPGFKRVDLGIVQVPKGRAMFGPLTVDENLLMGAYLLKNKTEIKRYREKVFQIFPRLKERIHQLAETLSGGEQQMLSIGRALMVHLAF